MPQLDALEQVIKYIFDRNACLLPGYFIINEIQKAYPDNRTWPHWVCFLMIFKNKFIYYQNKFSILILYLAIDIGWFTSEFC